MPFVAVRLCCIFLLKSSSNQNLTIKNSGKSKFNQSTVIVSNRIFNAFDSSLCVELHNTLEDYLTYSQSLTSDCLASCLLIFFLVYAVHISFASV